MRESQEVERSRSLPVQPLSLPLRLAEWHLPGLDRMDRQAILAKGGRKRCQKPLFAFRAIRKRFLTLFRLDRVNRHFPSKTRPDDAPISRKVSALAIGGTCVLSTCVDNYAFGPVVYDTGKPARCAVGLLQFRGAGGKPARKSLSVPACLWIMTRFDHSGPHPGPSSAGRAEPSKARRLQTIFGKWPRRQPGIARQTVFSKPLPYKDLRRRSRRTRRGGGQNATKMPRP